MEIRIVIVFIFTLIINLIATLAYSVRLVGIKTGRITVAASLFSVLALSSRFSEALKASFMAKVVEVNILQNMSSDIYYYFVIILSAACIGTLIGGIFTPSFQRILTGLVYRFNIDHSVPKLIYRSFHNFGIHQIRKNIKIPDKGNIGHLKNFREIPGLIILLNILVTALLIAGPFASLYAAAIDPDMRLTVNNFVWVITGLATITLVVFIDPFFSLLTDDVINMKKSVSVFHKAVVWLVISRFLGSVLAVLILVPCSEVILIVARLL